MENICSEDLNIQMETVRIKIEVFEETYETDEEKFKAAIDELSLILKEVSRESKFSPNESFNDIKTEDIKFLLIPYFQGNLIMKFMENREVKLLIALKFYDEFYKILLAYQYLEKEVNNLILNFPTANSKIQILDSKFRRKGRPSREGR